MPIDWSKKQAIAPRRYICGYCGADVSPNQGFEGTWSGPYVAHTRSLFIYICSGCNGPTHFDESDKQWPGVAVGAPVEALPTDVEAVYEEARRCMSVSAYTTAVMACRKLLMHIAVEKGAQPNKRFKFYVDWMVERHYVPPGGAGWVDVIRDDANEANHQIVLMDQHRAAQILSFVELLLKFIYEFPARVAGGAITTEAQSPAPSGHVEGGA